MMIEINSVMNEIRRRLDESKTLSREKQNRPEVDWLRSRIRLRLNGADRSVRAHIDAMPVERPGEFLIDSFYFIRLYGPNRRCATGEAVQADRGDQMRIYLDSGTAEVEIDAEGRLVFKGRDGSVARYDPSPKPIVLGDEFDITVFDRVVEVVEETYSCAWSEGMTLVGADDCGKLNWSFSVLTPESLSVLRRKVGSDAPVDAFMRLRRFISETTRAEASNA